MNNILVMGFVLSEFVGLALLLFGIRMSRHANPELRKQSIALGLFLALLPVVLALLLPALR